MGRFFENFYSVSLQEYFVGFLLRFLFCFSDVVLFLSVFFIKSQSSILALCWDTAAVNKTEALAVQSLLFVLSFS